MPKYRKKPVVIDAFRFGYDPAEPWFIETDDIKVKCALGQANILESAYCVIGTLEGEMTANLGDYILKGVEGEIYPCKPDIFKKTYEKVKDEELKTEEVEEAEEQ